MERRVEMQAITGFFPLILRRAMKRVAVLGAGHGGFAAAADLTARGVQVALHARNPQRLAEIRSRGGVEARGVANGVVIPALLTTDVREAVQGAELVMLVVPSV